MNKIPLALAATLLAGSAMAAEPFQMVAVPTAAGDGKPREVKVLADTAAVKLAAIFLRKGTVLPEHKTPLPVTIQSISGEGFVKMGDKKERLSPERMVVLAPNVPHEVIPDEGTDMVLLVHHLKREAAPKKQGD